MRMKLSGPFLIYADLVALPFCWFDESYGGYTCSRASALVGMESPLLPPVYQGVDLQGTHDQRTWFANRGFCPHPRLSFRTYVRSNAVRRGITMHTPLSSCPVCSSCTRAAARTGREVLGLFAAALRTVPTHDEAGPLCRKLAEWIEGTIDTRHHADMCAIK